MPLHNHADLNITLQAGFISRKQPLMPLYAGLSDAGVIAVNAECGGHTLLVSYPSWSTCLLQAFPHHSCLSQHLFFRLNARQRWTTWTAVTKEVQLMMDPSADPFAAPSSRCHSSKIWGERCSRLDLEAIDGSLHLHRMWTMHFSECPANQTGKAAQSRAKS
jgi:hypothetical protein